MRKFMFFIIVAAGVFAFMPLLGLQQSGYAAMAGMTDENFNYFQAENACSNDKDIAPDSSEQSEMQAPEESMLQGATIVPIRYYESEKVETHNWRSEERSFPVEQRKKIHSLSRNDRELFFSLPDKEREVVITLTPRQIHQFLTWEPEQREVFITLEPDLRYRFFTFAPWERDFFITLVPEERYGFITLSPEERYGFYTMAPEERHGFFAQGGTEKRRELSERAKRGEFNKGRREAERGEPQGMKNQGQTGTTEKDMKSEKGEFGGMKSQNKADTGKMQSTTPREQDKGEFNGMKSHEKAPAGNMENTKERERGDMSGMKSQGTPSTGAQKNAQPGASTTNQKNQGTSSSGSY